MKKSIIPPQIPFFSMQHSKKHFLLIILSISTIWVGCSNHKNETTEKKTQFRLTNTMLASTTYIPVKAIPVKDEMKLYGKITTDNNKLIEVFPVVGGNVLQIFTELGDYVSKGQLLATIRSAEAANFENLKLLFIIVFYIYKLFQANLQNNLLKE